MVCGADRSRQFVAWKELGPCWTLNTFLVCGIDVRALTLFIFVLSHPYFLSEIVVLYITGWLVLGLLILGHISQIRLIQRTRL